MIKTYTLLTKPGILMGNAITAVSGFTLASKGHFDWLLFLATLSGLSCVIASACIFNNFIDRNADEKMERTKDRALVKKLIPVKNAIFFAIFLGFLGFCVLTWFTPPIGVFLAGIGFFVYVVLYSFWKYHTVYATLIGSISGAIPPVVGYCTASGHFDLGAFILFMILVLWQMPHFYSIAMYRYDDYQAASIPVLPVKKGVYIAKIHMFLYIIAFILATIALTAFGYTGQFYLAVTSLVGLAWLGLCIKGFQSNNNKVWGRQMFIVSLVVVNALCITMALDVA
ncbi:MAG: heme o synthase [Parachlamydiaceae bacterium]